MKRILVLGIDGVPAELLLEDERLEAVRRLMSLGCFGPLQKPDASTDCPWEVFRTSRRQPAGSSDTPVVTTRPIRLCEHLRDRGGVVIRPAPVPVWPAPGDLEPTQLNARIARSALAWEDFRRQIEPLGWSYSEHIERDLVPVADGSDPGRSQEEDTSPGALLLEFDQQIGATLELLDDETIVLLVSPRGTSRKPEGVFVLAAAPLASIGLMHGVQLVDLAPSLLRLVGENVPAPFEGSSLFDPALHGAADASLNSATAEELIRERLRGLGYIL